MNTSIRSIITLLATLITACDAEPQLDTPDVQQLAKELRACNDAPSDGDVVTCAIITLAELDDPTPRCGTSPSPNPNPNPEPPPKCKQIGNKTICPPAGTPEPLTLDPIPNDRFAGAPETNGFIDHDIYMECSSRDGHADCLCGFTCCRNQTQCACDDACPLPLPPSISCGGKPCPPFPHPSAP